MKLNTLNLFLVVSGLPLAHGAMSRSFYWKPRLGVDFAIPTKESPIKVPFRRTDQKSDSVVFIDAYRVGLTIMALGVGISDGAKNSYMNPMSAYYYTNMYRWVLRHLSMLPQWLKGDEAKYCDTHKVWQKRFYYMDEFVPNWMRKLVPWVHEKEWKREIKEMKWFKILAESTFAKHYKYPSEVLDNLQSNSNDSDISGMNAPGAATNNG